MSKKRIIEDLSTEELIKLATSSSEPVDMGGLTDAARFIYEKNIKSGKAEIEAELVYFTYKQWRGKNSQPRPLFFKDFKKYFDSKRKTNGIYYLLNPKSFDLSDENIWVMRALKREEKNKKEKKRS